MGLHGSRFDAAIAAQDIAARAFVTTRSRITYLASMDACVLRRHDHGRSKHLPRANINRSLAIGATLRNRNPDCSDKPTNRACWLLRELEPYCLHCRRSLPDSSARL